MTQPFVLPETATLLQTLASMEGPHLGDVPAADARAVYQVLGDMFDDPADPDVRITNFAEAGCDLRAYFPGKVEAGPVIVYLHGGGWVIGDLDTHHSLCSRIARLSGLRVVAVDYRLAPEHPYPAAHDDCLAAAQFVAAGPPELEAPVTGIAVAGDSAGGNLAFHVAAKLGAEAVLAQLLIYPVGDCTGPDEGSYKEFAEGYLLDRKLMDRFIVDYLPNSNDAANADVSPALHNLPASLPPAVVLTAGLDPLRDQGRALAGRLAMQGVEVHFVEAAGLIHGLATMRKAMPTGDAVVRRVTGLFTDLIWAASANGEETLP